jgi:hypothetical protein
VSWGRGAIFNTLSSHETKRDAPARVKGQTGMVNYLKRDRGHTPFRVLELDSHGEALFDSIGEYRSDGKRLIGFL